MYIFNMLYRVCLTGLFNNNNKQQQQHFGLLVVQPNVYFEKKRAGSCILFLKRYLSRGTRPFFGCFYASLTACFGFHNMRKNFKIIARCRVACEYVQMCVLETDVDTVVIPATS